MLPGAGLSVGGKDVEIDSVISRADFMAGKPFLGNYTPGSTTKELQPEKVNGNAVKSKKDIGKPMSRSKHENETIKTLDKNSRETINSTAVASMRAFKSPFSSNSTPARGFNATSGLGQAKVPTPRHDPNAPNALVMPRPPPSMVPKGKQVVDVVVDPLLAKHLRPHQQEGVQFLYECVMGMKHQGSGAILADQMGLGKTLQAIALIWTLLKQNPIYDEPHHPVVKKVLIVCPATLVANWKKEFRKWLGLDRIGVFVADDKYARLTDFTMGRIYSVMIIGYERLRNIQDELKKGQPIDLIVADEGHRLKTAQNKSSLAIKSFDTERRIVLTGTLLQNTVKEMYETVDLVNPGALGKYNVFKRQFETPIMKGQESDANKDDTEKGEARREELVKLTGQFMLRRTVDVIAKFLPPKTETVLFCRPTATQAEVYQQVLKSPVYGAALGNSETSLQLITVLKKVCNGPSLLNATSVEKPSEMMASLLGSLPAKCQRMGPSSSSKLQLLDTLLHHLRETTEEKIVLVSNYTTTLDMMQRLLVSLNYPFLRLDGKTPQNKRQTFVDEFNKAPAKKVFCFLLSTKAGGMGLNLVGASRLVLFDVDWNPAHDLQAMARIHRDGQRHPCFIYRLVVAGTLEEKIYQRQVSKTGLSDAVVDAKKTMQAFSQEELKALFKWEDRDQGCSTHDLLECECNGEGNLQALPGSQASPLEIGTDDDEDDESLPALGQLIKASKLDVQKQEETLKVRQKRSKRKEKMLALMQYLHIDVSKLQDSNVDLESLVEDPILLTTLRDPNNMVAYAFSRTTS
jgi:DNA repair and recombination protein RAD54B